MTVHTLSSLPGVIPGDTGGVTNTVALNAYIAASVNPGDVVDANCPIKIDNAQNTGGPVVVQNKLGVKWIGAGAMGTRISANASMDSLRWISNESCVLSDVAIAPLVTQASGIGLVLDEASNGLDNKIIRVNVFDRNRQQGRWGLGTGKPYKGFAVLAANGGGYKTRLMSCQANGCVSDGLSVGTYNQSARGPVGVELHDFEAGYCGGNGVSVFASEALVFHDFEFLGNVGYGLLTYPDSGGVCDVALRTGFVDSNKLHGVFLNAGAAGAGGKVTGYLSENVRYANQGTPDFTGTWQSSAGLWVGTAIKDVSLFDNEFTVNGSHGAVIALVSRTLNVDNNRILSNGQDKSAGGPGGQGMWIANLPANNKINNNQADGSAFDPPNYTAQQFSGIQTVSGATPNATGNVSKNPNYGWAPYTWHVAPNAANNQ